MKNFLKYNFIAALILIAISCRDEELVRFPDVATGVNARLILYPDRSFIDFSNLDGASLAFDVYSINNDLEELVYTANYVDASGWSKAS